MVNVITEEMKAQATQHLDDLNNLRSLAFSKHISTIGKIGEEKTYADAMDYANKYQAALEAYAKLGFRNLGIHNVK
jgi:hypothetical protein